MKEFTEQLIKKYKLDSNSYYQESIYPIRWEALEVKESQELEKKLLNKWQSNIPAGWYGFDLAPCPKSWLLAIDEFLEELKSEKKDFEIHQIKMKWGGLRCYLGNITKEQQEAASRLEEVMCDLNLRY